MTNQYFNEAVAKMNCAAVREELTMMAAKLNNNQGADPYSDNYIADLRNRSRELGCEMSIDWNAQAGKYEVSS